MTTNLKQGLMTLLLEEFEYRCKNKINNTEIRNLIIDLACDHKDTYQIEIDLPMLEMVRDRIDNAFSNIGKKNETN